MLMLNYKLSQLLTSFIGLGQWLINSFRCDVERYAILVSGVPRSGTTWLAETLLSMSCYKLVFEPLRYDWYPQFRTAYSEELAKIVWKPDVRPYVYFKDDDPKLRKYLKCVFNNKVIPFVGLARIVSNPNLSDLRRYFKAIIVDGVSFFYKYPLVKFVRGNRLLPWIAKNFHLRAIYMIIRHPCATIYSHLKTFKLPSVSLNDFKKYHLLRDVYRIRELENLRSKLVNKALQISSWTEALAFLYALDYFVPLSYQRNGWWYTVVYEQLVLEGEEELKRIFGFINEKPSNEAYAALERPSRTARKQRGQANRFEYLYRWRCMPKDIINKIMNVLSWFEMNFYQADRVEPDYKLLYNFYY